jgi:uncharacterized protein (DUF4213/DUF364 family)
VIKNVVSTSPSVIVYPSGKPYVANGGQSAGDVRMNLNTQVLEAYNGVAWVEIGEQVSISISAETQDILRWAYKKMLDEARIKELANKYPAVKDLQEKLDIMLALTQDSDGTN